MPPRPHLLLVALLWGHCVRCESNNPNNLHLDGMASYAGLLLAPAEGFSFWSRPIIQKFSNDSKSHTQFKSSPMIQKFTHISKVYPYFKSLPIIQKLSHNFNLILLNTRRYSLLCRLASRSCGGLWPSAEAFFSLRATKKLFMLF